SGTAGSTGIRVLDANGTTAPNATATIQNNGTSIHGFAIGIDVDGGTAPISGNLIYDNGVGVRVTNGGPVTTLDNNKFDSATDNGTDLRLDSTASTVTIGANNQFAGDTYYIDNRSAQSFNLVGNGTTFDQTDNFRIEDRMFHAPDASTSGLITWVANNLWVTT